MTTIAQVHAAIRARLEAGYSATPIRWKNETEPLPDMPGGFVYAEISVDFQELVAFGGGPGGNEQQSDGQLAAHVLVPVGTGAPAGAALADAIVAAFPTGTYDGVTYLSAEAQPGAGDSEDGNYDLSHVVAIDFFFRRTR